MPDCANSGHSGQSKCRGAGADQRVGFQGSLAGRARDGEADCCCEASSEGQGKWVACLHVKNISASVSSDRKIKLSAERDGSRQPSPWPRSVEERHVGLRIQSQWSNPLTSKSLSHVQLSQALGAAAGEASSPLDSPRQEYFPGQACATLFHCPGISF